MKQLLIGFVSIISLNAFGAPCNGAPGGFHKNPDGSVGGFVAKTANVVSKVYLDSSSSICDRATVGGASNIRQNSIISGEAIVEGNSSITSSRILGKAKVFGSAVILNSSVCQASEINFKVIQSDYYCQSEDPEPNHPGELGKKTVIGIDSDIDGVRDDVEIWINNNTSNTPNKDMYNARMALKSIAAELQSSIKNKDHKDSAKEHRVEALYAMDCLKQFLTDEEFNYFQGNVQVQIYNTMDRLNAWARTEASLNGMNVLKKRKNTCAFKVR